MFLSCSLELNAGSFSRNGAAASELNLLNCFEDVLGCFPLLVLLLLRILLRGSTVAKGKRLDKGSVVLSFWFVRPPTVSLLVPCGCSHEDAGKGVEYFVSACSLWTPEEATEGAVQRAAATGCSSSCTGSAFCVLTAGEEAGG